jgi:poly-gamma-glutamate synthesis protein (capsule biosynthesis protein)
MADAIKAAGFDMLLTANNHTNDSDDIGMIRTLDVISGLGMDFLGTKYTADAPDYVIKEVNGISIGMVCYTYEYPGSTEEKISLNGLPLTVESTKLVSSFNYDRLDAFYAKAERHLQAMKAQGAEATVVFIHWGAEYKLVQNDTQSAIAQKLCDLGVDVIVGGHPHVVQPMELLTSTDGSRKTVCLYSTGNLLSNQRRELMRLNTGHTEDALLFNFTFAKYSDGTVVLQSADITPAWVNMYAEGGRFVYSIVPLDPGADWTQFGLAGQTLVEAQASYQRTMDIVSPGLRQIREYLRQNVADTEANIGVN